MGFPELIALETERELEDRPLIIGVDWQIPVSLLKPCHGPCVHCGCDTEDRHEGEWMHDGCADELAAAQAADYRADDPRHRRLA